MTVGPPPGELNSAAKPHGPRVVNLPLPVFRVGPGVCTENLHPDVVVMKSAKDRV
jgi:hypothetical protein